MPNEDKWYISGPLGIGTSPSSGKLQFDNNGGDKIVVFDLAPTNRYGFGLNSGNLNAFVPTDGRFSIRQNGHDGTEVMTITGTGNVGIANELTVGAGGNAALRTRHIEGKQGGIDDPDTLYLNWVSGKDVQVGELSRRSNLFVCGNVGIGTTTPTSARLQFDNNGGDKVVVYDAGPTDRYGFGLNSGNLNAFVPAGGRFSVRQNGHDGTEVMTITGTGNVGIGTSSPDYPLHVKTDWGFLALDTNKAGQDSGIRLIEGGIIKWHIFHESSHKALRIVREGSDMESLTIDQDGIWLLDRLNVFSEGIHVNGKASKPGGGSWEQSSDIQLKHNVTQLLGSLDLLLKLQGVAFEWKQPEKQGNLTGVQRGFIAQDVEKIFPEWVGTDREGYKTLTIYGFEALAVEALRELKTDNDRLVARVQKLESWLHHANTAIEVTGVN